MRAVRQTCILAVILALCACLPVTARATQSAKLDVTLTPERLGKGTTIVFDFQIAAGDSQVPSPLTALDLSYPANLGIVTSGLGLATCSLTALEVMGPPGCPADSRMGYGSASVEVPFGPTIIKENSSIAIFMGPPQEGRLGLLFYADGMTPIAAELIFPSLVLPAPVPYGGSLDTTMAPVPTLPGAPDAAVVRLHSTIGPLGLTYYERSHGRTRAYRPNGIVLPGHCPRGGFPFAALFTFQDHSQATAYTTVPCPR